MTDRDKRSYRVSLEITYRFSGESEVEATDADEAYQVALLKTDDFEPSIPELENCDRWLEETQIAECSELPVEEGFN
jgi:hypothetical protein